MLDTTIDEGQTAGAEIVPAVSTPTRVSGICLLGSHPATVMQAPYDDPTWAIWACSPDNTPGGRAPHAAARPRVDEFYELHIPVSDDTRPFPYLKYVSDLPFVWMRDQKAMPHFKGARLYPEVEMKAKFNPFAFTSSIAYMLAMAITRCEEQGIKQIALYGILQSGDLDQRAKAGSPEYAYQRPGTQYFIWEAAKRGIKVLAASESRLFEPPPDQW